MRSEKRAFKRLPHPRLGNTFNQLLINVRPALRSPLLSRLVLETLREVREKLSVDASLDDVVLQGFHPWMAVYVKYGDSSSGLGFCASVREGMYGGLGTGLLDRLFGMVGRGEDAYRVVEGFAKKICEDDDEQVLMNALAVATLNALSHRLLSREVLEEDGFRVEEHPRFGSRLGAVLRRNLRRGERLTIVGYAYWMFPYVVGRVRELRCLELMDEELFRVYTLSGARPRVRVLNDPEEALEGADVVAVTGMTIPNETLPKVLECSSSARMRMLYGPSCSFYPKHLFELGVDLVLAMKAPTDGEFKQSVIDGGGLNVYQDERTKLIEVRAS